MNVFIRSFRSVVMAGGLLLSSGLVMSSAMAATITYNFSGDISGSTPPSIVSGFFTVNQSDSNSNSNNGTYNVQNFQFAVNGNLLQTTGTSGVVNILNGTGSSSDIFSVTLNGPATYSFQLIGPNNLFTSDALPNPVPSLSSFAFNGSNLFISGFPSSPGSVATLTAVSLPAAVILFGVGIVALIGLGAGGLRNVRALQT
ncbi:MAG: hypothetical protein JSS39_10830 [Nitrospira sp.]|nr:hypothetical protein [Nitrospira sp.]